MGWAGVNRPDTREHLLQGLSEKGFGKEQLTEMQQIINASDSDIFDVLAFVAYALPTVPRIERAGHVYSRLSNPTNSLNRNPEL